MYQTITVVLIIAVTAGLSLYDVIPATNEAAGDTISEILRAWSRRWPVLPWLWGVLAGHFFLGYERPVTASQTTDAAVLVWSSWILLLVSISITSRPPMWAYAAIMLAGAIMGHFFWSQA